MPILRRCPLWTVLACGNPDLRGRYSFSFTPVSLPGMSETPLHQDQACYGLDLRSINADSLRRTGRINLRWMMELYAAYPFKDRFFDYKQSKQMGDINKLAGTMDFRRQIEAGTTETEKDCINGYKYAAAGKVIRVNYKNGAWRQSSKGSVAG